MVTKSSFINNHEMKKVNAALSKAGYAEYPGDSTTAHPDGCKRGYVSNLLKFLAQTDTDAQKILSIINQTI